MGVVMDAAVAHDDQRRALLGLYDDAVGDVYGYLVRRCGSTAVAEDLTSETFLAAVGVAEAPPPPTLTAAWLIGVARHKLADHWRRQEREQRLLSAIDGNVSTDDDPWDVRLDGLVAHAACSTNSGPIIVAR